MARKKVKPQAQKLVPIPYGQGSIIDELENGDLIASEAMSGFTLHCHSHFDSGTTQFIQSKQIASWLGLGESFISKTLKKLSNNRLETIKTHATKGRKYRISSHVVDDDIPRGKFGKPLRFYVPRVVFQKMFEGKISWKACLLWISMKRHSEWGGETAPGMTYPATIAEIAKRIRLHNRDVTAAFAELAAEGLIERITPKNQAGIYQLFPQPTPNNEEYKPIEEREEFSTPTHWYSDNRQWRCAREDGKIQRQKKGKWKNPSEYEVANYMPEAIRTYFDNCIQVARDAVAALNRWDEGQTDVI